MEIAVVSTPDKMQSEIPVVIDLFKSGLTIFHLRKTKFSTAKLAEYIDAIPEKYHNRIIIHTHHKLALKFKLKGIHLSKKHRKKSLRLFMKVAWYKMRKPKISITRSFHQIDSLSENKFKYDYVFLNPFFSKIDPVKNSFDANPEYLKRIISKSVSPVYASGNINEENLALLKNYGVAGVALSKIIWKTNENKVELFQRIVVSLTSVD